LGSTHRKPGRYLGDFHFLTQSQTQKRVEELGGTTLSKKEPEGENGWYMYFKDVEGNRFGIYQLK
jgi:predicted enzyme related to lactoylglutathione lyase